MTGASPARVPFVAGNWKMHAGGPDGAALAASVARALGGRAPSGVEVAVFPPFPALAAVGEALRGSGIGLGAQACHADATGAFTGEVSAPMLAAWGCAFVLAGHSERRRDLGEGDAAVAARARAALAAGLHPVVCVGESAAERDAGRTAEVLDRQVRAALAGLDAAAAGRLTVAYEPVWAIGTGRNATPAQAAEGHALVRRAAAAVLGPAAGGSVRVIYGGSVHAGNAAALLAADGVDGALVGGASLDPGAFASVVGAAAARRAPVGSASGAKGG